VGKDTCETLQAERKRLLGLLAAKQRGGLRDPEIRKNIEIIAAHLADTTDLHRRKSPSQVARSEEAMSRIVQLLGELDESLCLEVVLDTRRCVDHVLIDCADVTLLRQRTAAEYAEQEATLPTWRGFYGPEPPDILGDRAIDESNEVVAVTRARLHRLVAARFWLYRPLRARRTLRIRAVTVLGPVLVLAGAGLGVALWQARVAGWTVVLAAAAGLTGAALSGFIKFRDEVRLGAQVRQFMPFYLVQLTVGAVFGLLVVLVVAAGWLTSETNTAVIGIISFAAGFSEPFAVGLVTKVAERTSV